MDAKAWIASVLPSRRELDEALGDDPAAALVGLARSRAPVEFGFFGDPGDDPALQKEFAIAQAAAEALGSDPGATLAPDQIRALHAFVHLLARPALRVVDGAIPAIPEPWGRLTTAHDMVLRRMRGVGRIDTGQRRHVGTGWFVAEDLILTNAHVAAQLCGLNPHIDRAWRDKLPAAVAAMNARWAADAAPRPVWDPAEAPGPASAAVGTIMRIRATHPFLDMALMEVAGVPGSGDIALRMHARPPAALAGHDVYIAGYPGVTPPHGVSPAVARLLFPDAAASGLKRVSPGRLVALVADLPIALDRPCETHDGSTLGGSSGSPVIDFDNHRVVALHYAGRYGEANYAVPLWLVKDEPFFADNGVRFAT